VWHRSIIIHSTKTGIVEYRADNVFTRDVSGICYLPNDLGLVLPSSCSRPWRDTMMMFIASPSLQKAPTLLLVMLMEGHTDNVFSLSFSPDCKLLCSGSDDKSIKFWNPADGSLVKSIDEAHTSGVTITADSNFIVSANTDKTGYNHPLPRVPPHGPHPHPQPDSPHRLQVVICVVFGAKRKHLNSRERS